MTYKLCGPQGQNLQFLCILTILFVNLASNSVIKTLQKISLQNATCTLASCHCYYVHDEAQGGVSNDALKPVDLMFQTVSAQKYSNQELIVQCHGNFAENLTVKGVLDRIPRNIDRLTISGYSITSLTDVCCLEKVKFIDFSNNSINDALAYYQFESVISLNLSRNDLSILRKEEFMSFMNVRILDLSHNNIDSMDQETFRLVNLKQLNLSRNKIGFLSERLFRHMPSIEELILSHNKIIVINSGNFFYSKNLKIIDISHNGMQLIAKDAFEYLDKLLSIDLSYNNFKVLPLSQTFQKLISLQSLIFDGNPISVLNTGSIFNVGVEKLSIKNMPNLRMLTEGAVANCYKLKSISFDNSPKMAYVSERAFKKLPSLENISFINCALIAVPRLIELGGGVALDITNNSIIHEGCQEKNVDYNKKDTKIDAKIYGKNLASCQIQLTPVQNETINVKLGAGVSLFCAVWASDQNFVLEWTKNGLIFEPKNLRIKKFAEQLKFAYTKMSDAGLYQCRASIMNHTPNETISVSRHINLLIEDPDITFFVDEISSQWIYLSWNKSSHMLYGEFLLEYYGANDLVHKFSYLPTVSTTFRISHLKPETNYTLCLLYRKSNEILYKSCIGTKTPKATFGPGAILFFTILAAFLALLCISAFMCVLKFVRHYFFIWQEAKHSGRLMETWSTTGFLASGRSSVENIAAVTFENMGIFDKKEEKRQKMGKKFQTETNFDANMMEHREI